LEEGLEGVQVEGASDVVACVLEQLGTGDLEFGYFFDELKTELEDAQAEAGVILELEREVREELGDRLEDEGVGHLGSVFERQTRLEDRRKFLDAARLLIV